MDLNEPQVLNDKGLYQDGSQADGMGNDMANGREHVGDESVAQEDAQVNDRYDNDNAWATEDDWIWKITADSEEGDRKVQGGVPLFMIDGEWRHVSHKHWAWTPLVVRRKTYRQREDTSRYIVTVFWEYDSFKWIPKLICTPAHIRDSPMSMLPRSLSSHSEKRRDAATLGARFPPELFPLILDWVDGKLARTCRLVCQYWEEQCRERAFARINLKYSEMKVLDLVRLKYDPAWRHIPSLAEELQNMPIYTQDSKRPWLHLLDPRWRPGSNYNIIAGPFPGRPTIRSIHFDLPRSPPSSFSRGITTLKLESVYFRRFEDTIHLVSELPDLTGLWLQYVRWKEPLPTELPRRRPQLVNKLRYVRFDACKVGEVHESPWFIFASLILFPHVSMGSSLFSVNLVIALEAIFHVPVENKFRYQQIEHTSKRGVGGFMHAIDFSDINDHQLPRLRFMFPEPNAIGSEMISVFIDFYDAYGDWSTYKWETLNTAIGSLGQQVQFLLGFSNRACMLRFAAAVVDKKLPSLSTHGRVRYAMTEKRLKRQPAGNMSFGLWIWYGASLESDQLYGKGTQEWWTLYP